MKKPLFLILIPIFCLFKGFTAQSEGSHELFPDLQGWELRVEKTVYTPDNLWELIDGAAEAYINLDFVDLHIAQYTNTNGESIRVELYRHSTPVNTFGIYAMERSTDYDFIEVGTQGYLEEDVLNFLTGVYYAKCMAFNPGDGTQDALKDVAGAVVAHLKQKNEWPVQLQLFPKEGLLDNTQYFVLNNVLGYGFLHSAFFAEYDIEGVFQVFIIELQDQEEAGRMLTEYLQLTKQEAPAGFEGILTVKDPYNGDIEVLKKGRYICGVMDAGNPEMARKYLKKLEEGL